MTRRRTVIQQKIEAPIEARAWAAEESSRLTAKVEAAKLVKSKVEAAMRDVESATRAARKTSISNIYESSIPLLAEKYEQMAFRFISSSAPPPLKKGIEKQLSRIESQATKLLKNLERLEDSASAALNLAIQSGDHPPARRVVMSTAAMKFDPRPKALGDIMGRLETLVDAAHRAAPPSTAKANFGPDWKSEAREIAKAAGEDYRFLAGKPPNRSRNRAGFLYFLKAIFEAFGRDDSVENFAKEVRNWWKNSRPIEDRVFLKQLGIVGFEVHAIDVEK